MGQAALDTEGRQHGSTRMVLAGPRRAKHGEEPITPKADRALIAVDFRQRQLEEALQ
jgi:hypothetical protein